MEKKRKRKLHAKSVEELNFHTLRLVEQCECFRRHVCWMLHLQEIAMEQFARQFHPIMTGKDPPSCAESMIHTTAYANQDYYIQ